jgi:hypothetical protein
MSPTMPAPAAHSTRLSHTPHVHRLCCASCTRTTSCSSRASEKLRVPPLLRHLAISARSGSDFELKIAGRDGPESSESSLCPQCHELAHREAPGARHCGQLTLGRRSFLAGGPWTAFSRLPWVALRLTQVALELGRWPRCEHSRPAWECGAVGDLR